MMEISEEEIKNALLLCKHKKSPGPDGLTYEFYLKYFELLKGDIKAIFNGILSGSLAPAPTWSEGVIVLLKKTVKPKDPSDFRPITLLNTDYKLFMKILALRLQKLIPRLTGTVQSACKEDQNVVTNLKELRHVLADAEADKKMKFAILSVDLKQVFDRVDQQFLWRVLAEMGFPTSFIRCLEKVYLVGASRLNINGKLTSSLKIERSVRQGCPLSMPLFALYLTPLLTKLEQRIRGVMTPTGPRKMKAYADDLELFISEEDDIDGLMVVLHEFERKSGAVINFEKSGVLLVNNPCLRGPLQFRSVEKLNVLGLTITDKWSKVAEMNYSKIISNMALSVKSWYARRLNLIQRVWVANTYLTSKLWYLSQIIAWKNMHIAKFTSLIGKFFMARAHVPSCQRSTVSTERWWESRIRVHLRKMLGTSHSELDVWPKETRWSKRTRSHAGIMYEDKRVSQCSRESSTV